MASEPEHFQLNVVGPWLCLRILDARGLIAPGNAEIVRSMEALHQQGPVSCLLTYGPGVRLVPPQVLPEWLGHIRRTRLRFGTVVLVPPNTATRVAAKAFKRTAEILSLSIHLEIFGSASEATAWLEANGHPEIAQTLGPPHCT